MGFAILIGTLAVIRLVNQPDYNDPEFWKGARQQTHSILPDSLHAVYRPTGPSGPNPTPALEQFDKTNLQTVQVTTVKRPVIEVEEVPVQINGKERTMLVLTPGDERQTRDAAMLASVEGMVQINK
jgi:hypothetical protein